jgi:hypothetical protein
MPLPTARQAQTGRTGLLVQLSARRRWSAGQALLLAWRGHTVLASRAVIDRDDVNRGLITGCVSKSFRNQSA